MRRVKGGTWRFVGLIALIVALLWLGRTSEPFQATTTVSVTFKRASGAGTISNIQVSPPMLSATSPGGNTLMITNMGSSLGELQAINFERIQRDQTAFSPVEDGQIDNNQPTKIRFDLGSSANKLRKGTAGGALMRGHKKLPKPVTELNQAGGIKIQNLSEGSFGSLNGDIERNIKINFVFAPPTAAPAPAPPQPQRP